MGRKSKLLAFILSCIPGLGQVYLGFSARGAIFLGSLLVSTFFVIFISSFMSWYGGEPFYFLMMALIYFASMVDAMILTDKINSKFYVRSCPQDIQNTQEVYTEYREPQSLGDMEKQNKKILSLVLSIIPGVGHLYLGLQRQGIELMAAFFICLFLSDWVMFRGFLIFAPIIWFYGLFDVFHKVSGDRAMTDDDIFSITDILGNSSTIKNKRRFIGYGLIIIGILVMLNRVVFPSLEEYIGLNNISEIQTTLLAIVFILGGVKLLALNRKKTIEVQTSEK